ncbi:hypothetical protein Y1Q_0001012 [Alligator mississippiensis]|uniref:Uncharacterized protein n=1 Tax=Alligator mississippiensis TaxID=8496 RepID=A0A151NEB7_ALLMI|nr:hypothetical protein Y1Q_0001012 [Alligator mississippiensis]
MPEIVSQGPNRTEQGTANIIVVWGDTKVQQQSVWATQSNAYIYETKVACMHEHGHQQSGHKWHIKAKDLWAQWVHITDHNYQSGAAHKTTPFMQQLGHILAVRNPGKAQFV